MYDLYIIDVIVPHIGVYFWDFLEIYGIFVDQWFMPVNRRCYRIKF
jgi:hypothetical protein